MKNFIILTLLVVSILYSIAVTNVAKECESHFGWSFHSVFPVPTCNVMENKSTLEQLENIDRIVEVFDI